MEALKGAAVATRREGRDRNADERTSAGDTPRAPPTMDRTSPSTRAAGKSRSIHSPANHSTRSCRSTLDQAQGRIQPPSLRTTSLRRQTPVHRAPRRETHLHELVDGVGVQHRRGEEEPEKTLCHAAAGHLPLDTLGPSLRPTPPASRRLRVSATSRRPAGHRRRRRPAAPPEGAGAPLFASLNCSD